ncbi:3'-5' exonuclease [Parasulfuritortus cantonensis]|uniref:3'-5' exonuclease n=1 Tax=Parasulfuritortus cantonensis TaxID=2528202 RepID=A0A4R1B8B6_9PROT|nr:3'-5' exonuclease [Parasulfuritortus cantonensis]TCJ12845.1 3'-5' exonuclease [Parasulfuritortus cantonensis]
MNWLASLFGRGARLDAAQQARLDAWRALPAADLKLPIDAARYVVVDVESSGLDLNRDKLIAIGAIAIRDGRIDLADGLEIVLQQDKVSGKDNILIHGIGGEAQRAGVPPVEALLSFLEYLGKDPLIAFHVVFDNTMISKTLRKYLGLRFNHPWADLAFLTPELCPGANRQLRALDDWMGYFNIGNYARHSALADAVSTAELMLALRPLLAGRNAECFRAFQGIEQERRMRTFGLPYA